MIIQLVTDRRRLAGAEASEGQAARALTEQVQAAIAAGVDFIQVREPDLPARSLASLVEVFVAHSRGTATRVVVNDRLDVALAAGAHGVHLRANSIRPADVRQLAAERFVIGCSVHSIEEAREAAGADYLVAGTIWPTPSKPSADHQLLGVDGLNAIVAAVNLPVLAIGGITEARIPAVASAGAAGVAAIGLFTGARGRDVRVSDLADSVDRLRRTFDTVAGGS